MRLDRGIVLMAMILLLMPIATFTVGERIERTGWGIAELLEHDDRGSASYPDIGTDAEGNAIAVWNQNDGVASQIVTSRYTKGIGWGDPEHLTAGVTNKISPRIAVNNGGDAVVVCLYSDATRYNVVAYTYGPDTGWVPGLVIETGVGVAYSPQVAINDEGYAIAVWYQEENIYTNIRANIYVPGTGWGSATLVENEDLGGASSPRAAILPDGQAIVVWNQDDGSRYNILANRYSPTSGWGSAELVQTDNTEPAYDPSIGIDGSGNAVAVWRQYDGSIYNVVSNRYTAGSGWGTAGIIESGTGQVQPPTNVAVDNDGYATAVWHQYDGSKYNIMSNRYSPGEGWGVEEEIDDLDGSAETTHIDVDSSGNVIAVWRQDKGGYMNVYANRFVRGSGWGKAELMETRIGNADVPRVSVDPSGNAIAVWYQHDGTNFNIVSNRFVLPDTTPPILVLSSPDEGAVTDIPSVTVSGTTEPGADVDVNGIKATVKTDGSFSLDLFLVPGENTIVLTTTDGSGNHVVETRTVTYYDPLVEEISSLTDSLNDLASSLSSIMGNISDIEEEIASIKEAMGSMNTTVNTSSIVDELENLSMELGIAMEDLTDLKERLSAIEGEGNGTVDLSGILDLIEDLENDIESNDAEISTLRTDVDSIEEPESSDLEGDVDTLRALVIFLGAILFFTILIGILLFIIMIAMIARRRSHRLEE